MRHEDYRVGEAKGKGMEFWKDRLGLTNLRRAGGREYVGPCPICGGDDRFGINTLKGQFLCRKCGGKGDEIGLVMFVQGLQFKDALDWMCGPRQELDAEELAKRAKRDAENKARKDAEAARYRAKAIEDARQIWAAGQPVAGSAAEDYLRLRGIVLPKGLPPDVFRFAPALRHMVKNPDATAREKWVAVHTGPAMLAKVQGRDNDLCAVHRTWFDLTQPQGKVRIVCPFTGEVLARKKGLGAKKGGAIRLVRGFDGNTTMVMGEGIETTFSAYMAGLFEGAHFWAGVDLGNMAGQRMMGKGLKYAGQPDLTDADAFVPPRWVTRLIYIQDGDSEYRETRAKLLAGLLRAKHFNPDLRIQIAECPRGFDLNDVLLGEVRHDAE